MVFRQLFGQFIQRKRFFFKYLSDSYRYLLPGVSDLRKCCAFSKDRNWMALLYRDSISISQQQDYISIFSSQTWECVHTFTVSTIHAQSVFHILLNNSLDSMGRE